MLVLAEQTDNLDHQITVTYCVCIGVGEVNPRVINDSLAAGEVVVTLLCKEGDVGREHRTERVHGGAQRIDGTGTVRFGTVQSAFDQFQVLVCEHIPGEVADKFETFVKEVVLHGIGYVCDRLGQVCKHPAVNKGGRCGGFRDRAFLVDLHQGEPDDVPHLGLESGCGNDIVPVELDILTGGGACCCPLTECVHTVGSHNVLRTDDVSAGLGHLKSVLTKYHTVD